MKNTLKKTALAAAVVTSLGTSASASAVTLEMSWSGLFTMLDPAGVALKSNALPYYYDPTWGYGLRTPVSGTLTFDVTAGVGTATIANFQWLDPVIGQAVFRDISLQAIGDGFGNAGPLVLGNMLWDWYGNTGMPMSIVWDAAGLFGALSDGVSIGETVTGVGALPASNGIQKGNYPIGPAPMATTTWNTTALCTVTNRGWPPSGGGCMGVNPSGGLPLIADTVGGSPMIDGPFLGYNINLDITSITIYPGCEYGICPPPIPVPAAVWLFGSGLLGLVGIARRKGKKLI